MSHAAPASNPNVSNRAQSALGTTSSTDDLVRVFNTAMVASRVSGSREFSAELLQLVESPAFRAILNAVRQYARLQGITERQAAEQVIQTFRKMDALWSDYVFQEGVDRLKTQISPG